MRTSARARPTRRAAEQTDALAPRRARSPELHCYLFFCTKHSTYSTYYSVANIVVPHRKLLIRHLGGSWFWSGVAAVVERTGKQAPLNPYLPAIPEPLASAEAQVQQRGRRQMGTPCRLPAQVRQWALTEPNPTLL